MEPDLAAGKDLQNGIKNTNGGSAKLNHDEGEVRRTLGVVFASLLLDLLAFTIILPLLPSILEYYGQQKQDPLYHSILHHLNQFRELVGAPTAERYNTVLFGGLLGSLFSMLQFLTCPIIGVLSDIYGRRQTLIISMFGIALSYLVWAISRNFLVFVLSRILGGIFKGNVTVCTAIVTDTTSTETRGKGMALIGVAYSLGFIIGPTIGAVFSRYSASYSNPFVLPAVFSLALVLLDTVFIYGCLKETLPPNKRAESVSQGLKNASSLINPLSLFRFDSVERSSIKDIQTAQLVGLVYFLYLFFFSGLEFTLTFLTHQKFQYSSMQQGMMFFYIGISMAIIQGGYVRRLTSGKEKRTALQGMILLIPAMIMVGIAKTPLLMYIGLGLFSYGAATVVPCLTAIISKCGTEDQKGKIMGIFRSLGALARGLAPFVACTLYWSLGCTMCYTVGAFMFLIPAFILAKKLNLKQD